MSNDAYAIMLHTWRKLILNNIINTMMECGNVLCACMHFQ